MMFTLINMTLKVKTPSSFTDEQGQEYYEGIMHGLEPALMKICKSIEKHYPLAIAEYTQ